MRFFLILGAAMNLIACTAMVSQSQIDTAVFPEKPSEQVSEIQIKNYMSSILKDPKSMLLACNELKKGWARQYRDRAPSFGWVKPCMVNAKNSFGGYSGAKPYVFLFSSDGLIALDGQLFREFSEHVGYLE